MYKIPYKISRGGKSDNSENIGRGGGFFCLLSLPSKQHLENVNPYIRLTELI